MERKGSGLGLVFFFIIILLIGGIILSSLNFSKSSYTRGKLEQDIKSGSVSKVTVNQLQNSKGGSVTVEKKNGTKLVSESSAPDAGCGICLHYLLHYDDQCTECSHEFRSDVEDDELRQEPG